MRREWSGFRRVAHLRARASRRTASTGWFRHCSNLFARIVNVSSLSGGHPTYCGQIPINQLFGYPCLNAGAQGVEVCSFVRAGIAMVFMTSTRGEYIFLFVSTVFEGHFITGSFGSLLGKGLASNLFTMLVLKTGFSNGVSKHGRSAYMGL